MPKYFAPRVRSTTSGRSGFSSPAAPMKVRSDEVSVSFRASSEQGRRQGDPGNEEHEGHAVLRDEAVEELGRQRRGDDCPAEDELGECGAEARHVEVGQEGQVHVPGPHPEAGGHVHRVSRPGSLRDHAPLGLAGRTARVEQHEEGVPGDLAVRLGRRAVVPGQIREADPALPRARIQDFFRPTAPTPETAAPASSTSGPSEKMALAPESSMMNFSSFGLRRMLRGTATAPIQASARKNSV